ncbi:MAG: ABC transporter permease [Defluviitaleaceae bacterium]|nr:ABC transporter permease [Defluviitaleaceae bacterium]MCL2238496.1 ABC transporter permease [Defluviitaleaceae bacterium]
MRSVKAIFKKQLKDTYKNMVVLIQFFLFPVVAWIMTELVARPDEYMPDTMFVTMMASIFAGMGLIPLVASIIAEDRERKSLRFLVMAGVKPGAYLLGVGGVIFAVGILPALAFAFIGRFEGQEFYFFFALIMSAVAGSILLGATIGILSKNQQAASGLALPAAMVLGFGPMIAPFNERIDQVFHFIYTHQFATAAEGSLSWQPFAIMWANVGVLLVVFIFAYAAKGLRS